MNSQLSLGLAEDEDAEGRKAPPEAPGGELMSQPSILLKVTLGRGEVRSTHSFDEKIGSLFRVFLN